MAAGLLGIAGGLTVIVAWLTRATALVQVGSQHPMAFNTALAVAVTGAALVASARRRPWAVLIAGVFDAALGAAVLAEYALGRSLGIDQLIVKAYFSGPGYVAGRPPTTTAACLLIIGAALLAWSPWRSRRWPVAPAAAGSFIGAVAITAIVGYATGTPPAYVWGHVTAMALLTAAAFLLLAIALVSAAWHDAPARHQALPRWLPLPAAALAFGVAAAVWLAVTSQGGRARHNVTGDSADAATILGLVMAGLVALAVSLAQQADERRRMALAATRQAATSASAVRDSERRLFRFLDAMPVGVFIATQGGQPHYVNQEAERLLGRGVIPDIGAGELSEIYQAFVIGTNRLYSPERLPIVRALGGQSSHVDDLEIRPPDEMAIPLEVWGRPVPGASGDPDYGLAVFADVSERRAGEKTMADQAALLDLAHDAILVRDRDSRITYWNAGAEHTYGYPRAAAVGRISHELLGTRFPEPLADIERACAGDGRWEGELIHRCADGASIVVESRWVVQRGPDGSLDRFMEINRDITARKDAELAARRQAEEIQALNATLEEQVQQRTDNLRRANKNLAACNYSIAHDLRTPLRGISGFAEVLANEYGDRLDETGRGYAGRIQAASEHMARLIDDLLRLSRVSATELNLQEVDLSAEAAAICASLRADHPAREVRVTIEEGIRVTADRGLIVIALEHLLQNAWKFTAGRADAAIEFATTTVADAPFCCYVRDNGVGFDFAYVDKLFQPFQKLHLASEFPGTGIGLASVQRIVERHGGRAWAEGAVNRGATFYLTLDTK